MKNLKTKIIVSTIICLFIAITALAQTSKIDDQSTDKKQSIEVQKFNIEKGVEFPSASIDVMMAEIIDELTKLNKFSQVKMDVPTEPTKTEKTNVEVKTDTSINKNDPKDNKSEIQFLLTGTITKYVAGNRTKRFLVGFGAGKAKIAALIKITEIATGKVVLEKSVDGNVVIGLFGGDSNGATRGLAKEVASVTKKSIN